jgi:hypothetical protein
MKKIPFIIFFLISISVFSQDISGDWEGIMIQPNNGFSHSRYPFYTHIEQNGNKITGTNKITLTKDTSIYGITKFEGTFKKDELFFKELNIISENRTGHSFTWCIKTGTLKYREDADFLVLEGDWTAMDSKTCVPGTIIIKKAIDKQIVEDIQNKPVEIEKRDLKDGRVIVIPKEKITIIVSESAKEDGDTISLIFNDVMVLSAHLLTKKEHKIIITYDPNTENKLVLYAHNVGSIPPNTAKIQIKSGSKKQIIILKSNLNESDVIYFKLE